IMIITYQGLEFFKVQFGDTILAFNPISKDSKIKSARFGADIALVSLNDKDMNGADVLTYAEREPFVVAGPGEYEIKDVFIKGFQSKSNYGGTEKINTIYHIVLEGMNLCFLGATSDKALEHDAAEGIESVDILFVPIGGDGVLDPDEAAKLATTLEPKIIIPMHYDLPGAKNCLSTFLKEYGVEKVAPVDKLTLKKKDLEGKDGEVIVLSPQN
ncbi:MAG: MBL fold metallo-hydrolase, partial [bacterium]